ncbi:MAG TPA: hydrogenase maturation nickel metallochaperone HypA [Candidatus Limnocylindrales bacterium]
MHELWITKRVLEVALERASDAGAAHITALHLEIGEESDVSPVSVEFYWPQISQETLAEGAQLVFTPAADPSAFRLTGIDVDEASPTGVRNRP